MYRMFILRVLLRQLELGGGEGGAGEGRGRGQQGGAGSALGPALLQTTLGPVSLSQMHAIRSSSGENIFEGLQRYIY